MSETGSHRARLDDDLVGDSTTAGVSSPNDGKSIGELIGEVSSDLSTLMRQELELAKAEVKQEATKAGKGAGMLAGAGVAGHLVLVFLSLTLMFALATLLDGHGWAALIVTVLWLIVAGVLYTMGRKQLREVNPKPEQTVETLKEDVQWARTRTS